MAAEVELPDDVYQELLEKEIKERSSVLATLEEQRVEHGPNLRNSELERDLTEIISEERKTIQRRLDQLNELTGDVGRSRELVYHLL